MTPSIARRSHRKSNPRTLSIDIGGTAIKGSVLDTKGRMVAERISIATPYPLLPKNLIRIVAHLANSLTPFDRISIGFPGVVRNGCVMTAPHFGTKPWQAFPLEKAVAAFLKKPVRILNDAEVHGFGVISGRGLEVVLTLGTGIGSAVFTDGSVGPHLELAHHPIYENKTYNDYIGDKALRAIGKPRWDRRVLKTITVVRTLLNYDTLYLGGGNAAKLSFKIPAGVKICSNDAGIVGGIQLWSTGHIDSHTSKLLKV